MVFAFWGYGNSTSALGLVTQVVITRTAIPMPYLSRLIATHLDIGHPLISLTGAQSSNKLQRLDDMWGYQAITFSNGHQGKSPIRNLQPSYSHNIISYPERWYLSNEMDHCFPVNENKCDNCVWIPLLFRSSQPNFQHKLYPGCSVQQHPAYHMPRGCHKWYHGWRSLGKKMRLRWVDRISQSGWLVQ